MSDTKISIYVPGRPTDEEIVLQESKDVVQNQSLKDALGRLARWTSKDIDIDDVLGQWRQTIDAISALGSVIAERLKELSLSEVEVGLTLSAKGKLLFIAEAGAEASIKCKLTKKP